MAVKRKGHTVLPVEHHLEPAARRSESHRSGGEASSKCRLDCGRPRVFWEFSYLCPSVFICGPIVFGACSHIPSLISNRPVLNRFPLCPSTNRHPLPHNPSVLRACAGRSL